MPKLKRPIILFCLWLFICFASTVVVSGQTVVSDAENPETVNPDKEKIEKYFKMSLYEMMEVEIITAGKTPEKVTDIPASIVLITREDIETYGYRSLTEILEDIPGLYAIDDYATGGTNFGVRGFWSGVVNDNMIILVNNVSQVEDFESNYPLDKISVPVEAIDHIEVIRGPMSVIYGNGAFYGVINIFTNTALQEKKQKESKEILSNITSMSYGSANSGKLFLRVADQKGDFNYVFNASLYNSSGMDHPLSEMVYDPKQLPDFYNVPEDQTTGSRLEENEKYFNFSGTFKGFYLDLSYIEIAKDFYFLMPSFSDGHIDQANTSNISFGYKREFSKKFLLDAKMGYFQTRTLQDYDFYSLSFFGLQQFQSSALEAEINAFIHSSNRLDITTGLYYRTILSTSNMYDLPSFGSPTLVNNYFYLKDGDNIETRAFFAQVSYKPFKKLNLVGGIRFEQMPKYGIEAILAGGTDNYTKVEGTYAQDQIEVIPRLAAIFSINDKNYFKFLYGMAINRPSFFQNTKNSLDILRNDLRPEEIQTLEVNYIGVLSPKFTFSASVFRNELENLITRVVKFDDQGNYQTWSANAGKMITNGVELTLNTELFENFRLELSGTYQKTEDKRPGYENVITAYSPNFLGYAKAVYRIKKLSLAITGNYVDEMETFWDETLISEDYPFGNRIGDKVKGYFLLGANLRIEDIFFKGLFLNLRCSNVLDEEIRYPTFTNNQWATRGTIGIPRTFLLTLGWKF